MDKDLKKVLKEAERQGFTWRLTTKGHVRVLDANGLTVTVFAGTASDWRGMRNGLADLKRAGFQWPPRR